MRCLCGVELTKEQVACADCLEDMDKVANLLDRGSGHPYDGPMGIFTDYDNIDSEDALDASYCRDLDLEAERKRG